MTDQGSNNMTNEQIIHYAVEEGFAAAAIVDTSEIVFDPSFRNILSSSS